LNIYFKKQGFEYWKIDFLKIRESKTVIDPAVKQQAEEALEALKANDRVKALLQMTDVKPLGVSVFNELMINSELDNQPFGFKGILDNVVMDENTKIREMVALQKRVDRLDGRRTSLLDIDSTSDKISIGGLGGGMLLAGTIALAGWRRRRDKSGS
jgi:hypothetical protein